MMGQRNQHQIVSTQFESKVKNASIVGNTAWALDNSHLAFQAALRPRIAEFDS